MTLFHKLGSAAKRPLERSRAPYFAPSRARVLRIKPVQAACRTADSLSRFPRQPLMHPLRDRLWYPHRKVASL